MAQKDGGSSSHTPQAGGIPISSLTLPTANTARLHLGSKKKSDTKNVHPGYNMFDWNKLCNSGRDMAGTKGKLFRVTPDELAQHCTDGDLWTSVRGVIYNITLFTKYHPGGKAQLMRGAGHDCTELFDKIHVWVNSESILEKCIVGHLVGTKPPAKKSSLTVSVVKPSFASTVGSSSSQDNQGEDVLSLTVPSLHVGNLSISGAGDLTSQEDTRDSNLTPSPELSIPVPNLVTSSIQDTETSIPDSVTSSISIPVPTISSNNSYSNTSDTMNMSHIPKHPLISTTAYETAV